MPDRRWKIEADADVDPRVVAFMQHYVDEHEEELSEAVRRRLLERVVSPDMYVKVDALKPEDAKRVWSGIVSMSEAWIDAWRRMGRGAMIANHGMLELSTARFRDDRIPTVEPFDSEPMFWPPNETLDAWAQSRYHRDHRNPHRITINDLLGALLCVTIIAIGLYVLARLQA